MHFRRVVYALAIQASLASAYYSSGWSPDAAAATTAAAPSPSLTTSGAAATSTSATFPSFDWTVILKQGPIGDLFKLAGVNVTERLEQAKKAVEKKPYDERVPLITDTNYDALVKESGASDETWFIVVTLGDSRDQVSKYVDEAYDRAYDVALTNNDLPNIKWGRVDYMDVTKVTTEWMVWKAPVLVIARNHGKELRFLYPGQISLEGDNLYNFVKAKGWNEVPVWDGPFAPGGDLEKYVKIYAEWSASIYSITNRIPKWLFLVASGGIASLIIQFMHSAGSKNTESKGNGSATKGAAAVTEKPAAKPKRYVVKKADEVNNDLTASMVSSIVSESDGPDGTKRPRRSTRRASKK